MSEIWRLGAAELAHRIAHRDISAREAAQAALDRLDAVNPKLNAVVEHRPDEVLARAEAVDAAILRGENPGILAGVPVTIKVNTDQAGYATTNGVALQRDLIADQNNPVVDNLLKAGAVIVGRTNTPAFSLRWFTDNRLHGATRNPWDGAITPGGSSGGAAVATAVGIGAIGHGTDIAGSIRYPAYANGLYGLRPSLGRIPAVNLSGPDRPIGPQLSAASGPLARSVADIRLALAAMAVPDPRDVWSVPAPLEGPPRPRRAALCVAPDGMAVAAPVEAALHDAARRLQAAGWTVDEVAAPPLAEPAALQGRLWLGDGTPDWAGLAAAEGDPAAIAVVAGLAAMVAETPGTLGEALRLRTTLIRRWNLFLEDYAVLLLPVSGELPFPGGLDIRDFARVWRAQMPQVGLPLLGLPALAVPMGLVGTVPVGVQLVAARFREDLCLAAGEAIESAGAPVRPIDPAW